MDGNDDLNSLRDKDDNNSRIWSELIIEGDADFSKDVAQLLKDKSVYISGGFDKNGSPLIIFPQSENKIDEANIEGIFHYLVQRFGPDEREKGFAALIDRRSEKWMSVQFVLDQLMVTILNDINALYEYVDKSQLTPCLGGSLKYNHQEWVENRIAIDRFRDSCDDIASRLVTLKQIFDKTNLSSNYQEMEFMLNTHGQMWFDVCDHINRTLKTGETLLKLMKGDEDSLERKVSSSLANSQNSIADLQLLVDKMSRVKNKFEEVWQFHESWVAQTLQYNLFEKEFCEIRNMLMDAQKKLLRMKELGDSVTTAKELKIDTESLKDEAKIVEEKLTDLCKSGDEMINKTNYHSKIIKLMCDELQDSNKDFQKKIEERIYNLDKSAEVHEFLTQVRIWCDAGHNILASQHDLASKIVEDFFSKSQDFDMSRIQKTVKELGNKTLMEQAQMALKRISEVTEMIRNRLNKESSSKKMAAKIPVQSSAPVLSLNNPTHQTARSPPTSKINEGVSPLSNLKKENTKGQKSRSSKTQRCPISIVVASDLSTINNFQVGPEERPRSVFMDSPRDVDVEDDAVLLTKRAQVMNELVETEKVYVRDLQDVVEGYMKQYKDSSPNIPQELKSKKGIIFGNIHEIYVFHRNVFLLDLEKCANQPLLVGEVFLAKEKEFQMYATYCKNKPSSDALKNECAKVDFFVECQKSLGHLLPLHAYLLKPIQRITKYQLLLKQMIKYSQTRQASLKSLKNALKAMMKVLQNLNDVMHAMYIRGFLGSLGRQGKLLIQDSFYVWQSRKKFIAQAKGKPRQVFLYEKVIIITKRDDEAPKDNVSYQFESSLELIAVGLTETVKKDPLKFGLSHNKSLFYTLQAPSEDIKKHWVQEIRLLLQSQFSQVKKSKSLSMPLELNHKVDHSLSRVSNNNDEACNDVLTKSIEGNDEYNNRDENDWSDDEDENAMNSKERYFGAPVIYRGIMDYTSTETTELSFLHGEILHVLRVGDGGWWYARSQKTSDEGWVPGSHLEKWDEYMQ
ncbi:guanine nucleotide exchange factor DBS-like isoform X2 [Xenia sp. Carnegie-2017]|uniref:guanine nucleotide exchange factor DBS-like isoform X2 n=1 Tax=Xenia sp. Carnegie-2017 TaxID=2897299 RepID=UPI001F03F63D|nr:guanine nucleotide exchange factor DBS-like isoform X2 [Xenia sp. Carnegie-2017]